MLRLPCALFFGMVLAGCSSGGGRQAQADVAMIEPQRISEHRGSDDLLTAGLGLDGLRAMTPPQRHDLSVLVQRTPPQERALLRNELVSTAAASRNDWLWDRLHR